MDLKSIIKNLWYKNYNNIVMFHNYWVNPNNLRNFSTEELENFQNLKEDLGFCISRIGHPNEFEIMFDKCKSLNMAEYEKLIQIGDSEVGYDENQRKILSSREKKISGWVTANHTFMLTFLSTYFHEKPSLKIVEFGGGFGNICRLMFARKKYDIEKYSIIDQKGMQQVQGFFLKKTLSADDCKKINLIESQPEIQYEESYDLFISNHAITEFDTVKYFEHRHLMDKCRYVFISTCLSSVSEYTIMFDLLSKMEVVAYYAESDKLFHILLKNKQKETV